VRLVRGGCLVTGCDSGSRRRGRLLRRVLRKRRDARGRRRRRGRHMRRGRLYRCRRGGVLAGATAGDHHEQDHEHDQSDEDERPRASTEADRRLLPAGGARLASDPARRAAAQRRCSDGCLAGAPGSVPSAHLGNARRPALRDGAGAAGGAAVGRRWPWTGSRRCPGSGGAVDRGAGDQTAAGVRGGTLGLGGTRTRRVDDRRRRLGDPGRGFSATRRSRTSAPRSLTTSCSRGVAGPGGRAPEPAQADNRLDPG
jgi:hypothetical protein